LKGGPLKEGGVYLPWKREAPKKGKEGVYFGRGKPFRGKDFYGTPRKNFPLVGIIPINFRGPLNFMELFQTWPGKEWMVYLKFKIKPGKNLPNGPS